jgi:hypothetical protein
MGSPGMAVYVALPKDFCPSIDAGYLYSYASCKKVQHTTIGPLHVLARSVRLFPCKGVSILFYP